MNLGDLHKVWEIKVLKKAGEEEAKKILERIAEQVQPIMRKHKWRVKVLSEFCPKNPALLGLNVGAGVHVKLRLRKPNRDCDFYPFEQVLDTMLHELCHNVHGPHNASFYRLWDELRKECENLMSKGITGTGEGFDLPGRRVGGFSRQPPLSSLRQTTLAAAEKRSKLGALLPSGPKRLGGDNSIRVALSPVQAAAMAAERRLQDNVWCGSEASEESENVESSTVLSEKASDVGRNPASLMHHNNMISQNSNATSRKRNHESIRSSVSKSSNNYSDSDIVDLTAIDLETGNKLNCDLASHKRSCDSNSKLCSQSTAAFQSYSVGLTAGNASTSGSMYSQEMMHDMEETMMWQCLTCTLLNPLLAPICELCSAQKPKDVAEKYKLWSCKFCTLENSVKLEKCAACDQWRYSHGPPVATFTSHFST